MLNEIAMPYPNDKWHPVGNLRARMLDPDFQNEIKNAEIIFGVHPLTKKQVGLFFGIAQIKRVVRRKVVEESLVLSVPVDPDTDDIEVLVAMVKVFKGACCYSGGNFSITPGDSATA